MKKEEEISLPCNHNSNYGSVILKDEGLCISLRSNNPLSDNVKSELIKYGDILNVRYGKGFLSKWPKLYLETAATSKKIEINVAGMEILQEFVDRLNFRIFQVKNKENPEQSLADKLKEAKELLDMGVLSQDEFDEIKQKYLKSF
ncbi:MAG: SHOCT domain-containing protein [Methanobacterium sp.]